jgi:hypothetical protein
MINNNNPNIPKPTIHDLSISLRSIANQLDLIENRSLSIPHVTLSMYVWDETQQKSFIPLIVKLFPNMQPKITRDNFQIEWSYNINNAINFRILGAVKYFCKKVPTQIESFTYELEDGTKIERE